MYIVKRLVEFDHWFDELKDKRVRMRLARRLEKAAAGNLGDVKSVGGGVMEMREFFGPSWRIYFVIQVQEIIILLCGGDKTSQVKDIAKAKSLAKWLR